MIMQRSVVKWFDAKKGYGFIVNPQGGQDIFVHYSQIETDRRFKTLRTGQVVEYELHDGPKGPHAINVTSLDDTPAEAHDRDGDHAQGDGAFSVRRNEPSAEPSGRSFYNSF